MAYDLRLSSDAGTTLATLPKPLRDQVVRHLKKLADDPVALGHGSHFPYPPDCQLSRPVPMKHEGEKHEFMVLFRYSQDESALHIVGIGHYVAE